MNQNSCWEIADPQELALTDQIDQLATDLAHSAESDPLRIGTSAVDFLNLLGYYACGYFWARAAEIVVNMGDDATDFHHQQVAIAKFYFDKLLPNTAPCGPAHALTPQR